ncbi:MAG: hypothetical protein OCC49_10420 [Fibrobacterales bacterium]
MSNAEIIMAILGAAGLSGVSMSFVIKTFLSTAIKETITTVYKKQLENHKFLLKNSETVFEYKLNAAKKLYVIYQKMVPEKVFEHMEWEDVLEDIAHSFSKYHSELEEFLAEFQVFLSDTSLENIRGAILTCSDGKFTFEWDKAIKRDLVTYDSKDAANKLFETIKGTVEELRKEVNELISMPKS